MNDQLNCRTSREQAIPLSFAQRRLWLLDRLIPLGSVYNIEHVLRLSGELDRAALHGALNEVVRRHEVLRTHFGVQDGHPVQVIAPHLSMPLEVEDLTLLPPDEREREAKRRAQEAAETPYDLARGPLIRARLLRLAPSEHWLILTLHHIVTDGWSSGVLTRELTALYNALREGEASPLPELPVQYADYAVWQQQWLQGPVQDKLVTFWRKALANLATLELPADRPRPAEASYRGGAVPFTISPALLRSLKEVSRREGVTLFMTLLAAYQILLFRYSGQEDVAIGVPTAGRNRPQLEPMIGFFVNTIVLRGDLSGNPRFRQYLAQVRDRALDAYTHQDLPFEKLVEELAPKRDLSRNPLFQASLAMNNTPVGRWAVPGLEVRRIENIVRGTAKFDVALILTEIDGTLAGSLGYATDLFDAATIEQMTDHFLRLLEGIVAEPDCAIGELPLLGPAERARLLVEWNDTAADYPRESTLHQLFEDQAARAPSAVAVVYEDRQLTYGELDARANQLANHLRTQGVGAETLVGVCLERSLEMIVGLLGILKAGGAYVPLDPTYPQERLAFMLEDTRVPVLVTQERLRDLLPAHAIATVCLDRDWPAIAALPATRPPASAAAGSLAYVIYTSGSTGTPKGVMIEHRALVNHMEWMCRTVGFDSSDTVLQKTPISADAAVWEFYAPLMVGGRLVMAPPGAHRDPAEIIDALYKHGVTTVQLVPSLFRLLVDSPRLADCTKLDKVFCGGEALPREAAQRFFGLSRARLYNLYGPTETCIDALWWECRRNDPRTTVPIGRPIANTVIYVLDAHRQPVPVGVAGELYIGGDGLARGYWNRPQLTAECFVPDPFARRPGTRMYRTGDRARYLPDGNVEFLGRADSQVKLRGFRIELGEIESVLARHPDVREAAAVLREDTPGERRLVAYVTANDSEPAVAELRALAERTVPHYMLPDAFVVLAALPLSPNGKVDRSLLPPPGPVRRDAPFEPARTPIEIAIAEVWAELLDVAQVGRNDNFFDLGGHSLLGAELVGKLNRALDIDLTLRQLFETPTLRGLAMAALQQLVATADENETDVA